MSDWNWFPLRERPGRITHLRTLRSLLMLPRVRGRCAMLAGALALLFTAPVRADKLTKAEIGKLGKASTAFVEVPGRGSGTGFCIHSSGLFITNEHVIRGKEKDAIKVVLDA